MQKPKRANQGGQSNSEKKTFCISKLEDSCFVLKSALDIPKSQLWTLQEPHKSRIEKGLAWSAITTPKETDLGKLLKQIKGEK